MLKEPEIKLFGRKIYLPEKGPAVAGGEYSVDSSNESSGGSGDCDRCSEVSRGKEREGVRERGDGDGEEKLEQGDEDQETGELCETTPENMDDSQNANALSDSDDQPKLENEQNGQQKTLKKPDKILPCPRCNSMDTKFCYYNNYNVNQPRHFCKSCQRYWTAGGTMRNVPVGAGRRKNKNSTPHCHHITISEALQAERINAPNGFQGLKFSPNGTVLSFGPDSHSPLCESMASALNLAEKRAPNGVRNGYYKIDQKVDDSVMQNGNGFPSPVPIPGGPWSFPWNSAVPFPPICPPGYPFPYYPAPVWANAWNVPWLSLPTPTADQKGAASSPTSPLGKHSRNGDLLNPNRSQESSIVVPKTLRIDDPDEAAKSSIWSTLGIKYDSISREGLFKALQSKADDKKSVLNTSPLLQANPAALSRSISFQERA
ncbi:hypothetical protein ACS0TY_035361 [Phlomoides rotata]